MFLRQDDGYPMIDSCETRVVRLMWAHTIQRVYSTDDIQLDSYELLRSLPDAPFAKLVANAACGLLMDRTHQDDAVIGIRAGHFQRYVLPRPFPAICSQ